jgi:hypothetical protein
MAEGDQREVIPISIDEALENHLPCLGLKLLSVKGLSYQRTLLKSPIKEPHSFLKTQHN